LAFVGEKISYKSIPGWIACIYRFTQKTIDGYWVALILDNKTAACCGLEAKSFAPVLPLEAVGQEVIELLGMDKVVKLVNDAVWENHKPRLEQNLDRSASISTSPIS
jgi:hypothetical protein